MPTNSGVDCAGLATWLRSLIFESLLPLFGPLWINIFNGEFIFLDDNEARSKWGWSTIMNATQDTLGSH